MRMKVAWLPCWLGMIFMMSQAAYARMYGQMLCHEDGFHCQRVKSHQSWQILWPDIHERDIVMRINRMNTQLYPGIVLAVPNDLSRATVMDFSPYPKQINAPQEKILIIDTAHLAWGAYAADGSLVKWGPVSTGADYCQDIDEPCYTHAGSYRIFSLGSSDCISRKFPLPDGGAPMPYCMYFNNGQALHGEPNGLPGYNASHGCVRLYVNDAEWLRYSFIEGPNSSNDYRGTKIVIVPENNQDDGEEETDRDSSNYDDSSQLDSQNSDS